MILPAMKRQGREKNDLAQMNKLERWRMKSFLGVWCGIKITVNGCQY